jgi:hypothetical protein
MGDEFWWFAGQLTFIVCNQVMHQMTQKIPAKELTGKVIPVKKLHPSEAIEPKYFIIFQINDHCQH